ncbi:MAG: hypothetical protein AB1898_12050 [Acidobacteriota bacterium]
MLKEDLLSKVKELLGQEWNLSPDSIPDNAQLGQFEAWDSLGHISVMLALEARFNVEMNSEIIQSLLSVPRIVDFLAEREVVASS